MRLPRWTRTPGIIVGLLLMEGLNLAFCACILGNSLLVGLGFCMMGAGFLGFACLPLLFLKQAHRADGMVIAHKKYTFGEYYPIVRYTPPNGQEITFQSHVVHKLPASTKVTVLYDSGDPESAIINRFQEKYSFLLLFPFALPLLVFGIGISLGLVPIHPSLWLNVGDVVDVPIGNLSPPIRISLVAYVIISALLTLFGVLKGYLKVMKSDKHKHP